MTANRNRDPRGPVEDGDWPESLPSHVATANEPRHVHGFALLTDLGRHYDFGETAFTILSGTPPSSEWGRAINLAFTALAGTSVAEAPVHAATLSRRCTAPPRTALAIGMLGLTEQADAAINCNGPEEEPDADARALWGELPATVRKTLGEPRGSATTLALTILRAAGLTSDVQLIAAISIARLPLLAAEVEAVPPGDLRGYPMRLPDFEYAETDD